MRVKFTAKRLHDAGCVTGKSQSFLWDSDSQGLGLRCTANDAKTFIFQAKLNGKTLRVSIGSIKDWGIEDARKKARELKTIVDTGFDPRLIKKERMAHSEAIRAEAKKRELIVGDAWNDYLDSNKNGWGERHLLDHKKLAQKGGKVKKRGIGLTVDGVLYPLMKLKFKDVTAQALINWQKKEKARRPGNARQSFVLFRAFWRWCKGREEYKSLVDVSIVENSDLRKVVPKPKSKKHDVMQRAQLQDWFEGVRSLDNLVICTYLQALLLTGGRRNEIANIKWEDVDFRWSSIWIKDKVTGGNKAAGEGRIIPLTPYLGSLIKSLPRRNKWVFSSPLSASGRMAEPRKSHNKALDKNGLDFVTLHGLRRTFASLAEWVEMPVGIVAQIMGHSPTATAEKHYINRPLELLAVWHTKYEKWILEQASVPFDYETDESGLKLIMSRDSRKRG